ncbi:putative MFS family arabinose efflux permease [Nakamurella sp. UYEF19]|uniref:MFS transporter n=1 Tax=Nakamurella sp. UYEF19 TaxID=1756392 RepID=UPI003393E027
MLAFASFFLTLSCLPLHAISIGASTGAAGLVTTVMLVSTVATQTLVPLMVGRFGLFRVLAVGLVFLGAPAPLYTVMSQFWWVLVISGLRGVGFAVITVLMPLVATALVPLRRRGEAIGIYGLAIAIPNLIGVPIGVALTSAGQFRWVSFAAAAPLLALPLLRPLARSVLPATDGSTAGVPAPDRPTGGRVVPDRPAGNRAALETRAALRPVLTITVVLLVMTLSGGGVLTFLPVARPDGALATVALLVFGASGAVSRWRAGLLADRWGNRVLLPGSVLVGALGLALIATGLSVSSSTVVLVGAAALGSGYGALQNVSLLVAFALAGPTRAATASAIWNAAYDAGTAIGALVVGMVAAAGPGFPWTFAGCAVLITLSLPLCLRVVRRL